MHICNKHRHIMFQVFRHKTTTSTVINVVCVILNTFVRAGIYYNLRVEDRGKTEMNIVERKIPFSAVSGFLVLNTRFHKTEMCLSSA